MFWLIKGKVIVSNFIVSNRLYLLLGLAGAVTFLWLFLLRRRLRMKWYAALLLSVAHVFYGVFCVKAFAVLEGNPVANGAMSLFGAVFFMPLAYFLGAKISKRKTAEVFDIFAPAMIFTLACARVNCIFAGCCTGVIIPGHAPWRFPTREAELVFYAIFLAIIVPRVLKEKTRGEVYPLYMFTYGVVRAVLECFRTAETNSILHRSHIWAAISVLVGISFYIEMSRRRKSPTRKHN